MLLDPVAKERYVIVQVIQQDQPYNNNGTTTDDDPEQFHTLYCKPFQASLRPLKLAIYNVAHHSRLPAHQGL